MASSPRACGRRSFVNWLALLVVLPLLSGCSPSHGTLSGQVMYRGQPLPGGWLTFRPADSKENSVHALIGADGHYEATLPVGDVAISVDNQEWAPKSSLGSIVPPGVKLPPVAQPKAGAPPAPKGDQEKHPGSYVEIPQKYANTETSGLHYTVKKGADTHQIDLQ
jgi:hypothetical protein